MPVFKAGLRMFFRHPFYILCYVVLLSFFAVAIGLATTTVAEDEFISSRPDIAIIDRDGSALSTGLTDYLGEQGNIVQIEDERFALQDAVAQNQVSYIAIIPTGFADMFVRAATDGSEPPIIETTTSYVSISAHMMNGLTNEYLNTAKIYFASGSGSTQEEVVRLVADDMKNNGAISLVNQERVSTYPVVFMFFLGYVIMISVSVCVGVIMGAFNRTDVRRRNLTSPLSALSRNLQLAAACVIVMLIAWIWMGLLGLVVFNEQFAQVDPAIIGLGLLAFLAFATVPLALGFLLGQVTSSELLVNAVSNIVALVLSFLGGLWVSLDLVGGAVATIARFTPTFYYGQAITKLAGATGSLGDALPAILADIGILLLFSAALLTIGLVAGRFRMQSAEAGGNAGAERLRS